MKQKTTSRKNDTNWERSAFVETLLLEKVWSLSVSFQNFPTTLFLLIWTYFKEFKSKIWIIEEFTSKIWILLRSKIVFKIVISGQF